jgi:NADPH2:quinone reductase
VNAWQVASHGGLEALAPAELPPPAPGPGEVLVRVHAAALNFSDLLMIRGAYQVRPPLPFVPGQEIAGFVVGPDGSPWSGRRVAAKVLWGGFAELAVARESMLIGLPDSLSFEAGATVPVVWPTAWIALHERARLAPGESVLVHAGASGVGLAAVQLAKIAGARVAATAGAQPKLALAREAGADAVFDYREEDWPDAVRAFAPDGFDVVLDPVGGDVTDASIRLLGWGGRLLVVGFASGEIPAIRANRLLLRNAAAIGVYWSHDRDAALVERAVAEVLRRHAASEIRIAARRVHPFPELPRALAEFAGRQAAGKSVILGP